jgi:addiction module HigA family antidote
MILVDLKSTKGERLGVPKLALNLSMARTPIHPGEILADELSEIGISSAELARTLRVPANRISQIIAGKRAISADTALRLARYFGTTPDFWMNLQKTYELDLARQSLGRTLSHLPQRPTAAALDSQRA